MKNQSVVIVGGASGLGLATARLMIAQGATKIGLIDRNEALLAASAAELEALGAQVATAVADISRAETAHGGFEAVAARLGRIHALVNSAAIYPRKAILEISDEDWDLENAINIKGTYHMMVAAIAHMKTLDPVAHVRGRIVNITSVVGASGNPGQANYAAAKAGVAGMTRALARELGSRNITVNCVAPGFIDTDMTKALSEEQHASLETQIPLGRLGQPEDIAEAVAYLASPQAGYVTGQEMHVNGGMFMN